MPRGSKKGERRGGRQKGTPNKTTASVRAAILFAYDNIGGDRAFAEWAEKNPNDFYSRIYVKMLPVDVTSGGEKLAITFVKDLQ